MRREHYIYVEGSSSEREVNEFVAVLVLCESEEAKCRARVVKQGFEGVSGKITCRRTQRTSMRYHTAHHDVLDIRCVHEHAIRPMVLPDATCP